MKLKITFISIVLFFTVILLLRTNYFYSNTCIACHNEALFYLFLNNSFHSELSCIDCHNKEGISYNLKLFLPILLQKAKSYKNHHPINISSCTSSNCHVIENFKDVKKFSLTFSHEKHLKINFYGEKLLCYSCHANVAHRKNFRTSTYACFLCHKIKNNSNPDECFYCHVQIREKKSHPQKQCNNCHNIESSDLHVDKFRCLLCHDKLNPDNFNIDDLHKTHKKTMKIQCFDCHNRIIHIK